MLRVQGRKVTGLTIYIYIYTVYQVYIYTVEYNYSEVLSILYTRVTFPELKPHTCMPCTYDLYIIAHVGSASLNVLGRSSTLMHLRKYPVEVVLGGI